MRAVIMATAVLTWAAPAGGEEICNPRLREPSGAITREVAELHGRQTGERCRPGQVIYIPWQPYGGLIASICDFSKQILVQGGILLCVRAQEIRSWPP